MQETLNKYMKQITSEVIKSKKKKKYLYQMPQWLRIRRKHCGTHIRKKSRKKPALNELTLIICCMRGDGAATCKDAWLSCFVGKRYFFV